MPKFRLNIGLIHDRKTYPAGAVVDLPASEVKHLIRPALVVPDDASVARLARWLFRMGLDTVPVGHRNQESTLKALDAEVAMVLDKDLESALRGMLAHEEHLEAERQAALQPAPVVPVEEPKPVNPEVTIEPALPAAPVEEPKPAPAPSPAPQSHSKKKK